MMQLPLHQVLALADAANAEQRGFVVNENAISPNTIAGFGLHQSYYPSYVASLDDISREVLNNNGQPAQHPSGNSNRR